MYKLRYNVLALIQAGINFSNVILLIKFFGTSVEADVFLLSLSIISSLGLIQLLFVEQFLYFYNDLKIKDQKNAEWFFHSSFVFALIVGVVFWLTTLFLSPIVIKAFAFSLDEQRFNTAIKIFSIASFSLAFIGVNHIFRGKLNAEGYFSMPYVSSSVPYFFVLLALVWCFLSGRVNIMIVVYALAIGSVFQFILNIVVLKILGFSIQLRIGHPLMKNFIKNSISMRLGHNVHNFFFPLIVNNILSSFPVGSVSSFYYAQKIVNAIASIAIGPSQNVLSAKISELWSRAKVQGIKLQVKQFLKLTPAIYVLISFVVFLVIPFILQIISSHNLSKSTIQLIQTLFILLALWQLIIIIESPFAAVGISSKNSKLFTIVNSIFIVLFFLMVIVFKRYVEIFSLPIAAFFAQTVSFSIYTLYALMLLNVERFRILYKPFALFNRGKANATS